MTVLTNQKEDVKMCLVNILHFFFRITVIYWYEVMTAA